jgi:hypothetical protein
MRMKPLESAYDGSLVPLNHCGPVPPQPWSWEVVSAIQRSWQRGDERWRAYGDDDGWLGGHPVRHVDVHLNIGWVVSKVADLLQ